MAMLIALMALRVTTVATLVTTLLTTRIALRMALRGLELERLHAAECVHKIKVFSPLRDQARVHRAARKLLVADRQMPAQY